MKRVTRGNASCTAQEPSAVYQALQGWSAVGLHGHGGCPLQRYSAAGHYRDTVRLGQLVVGHCRDAIWVGTAVRLRAEGDENLDFKI